MGCLFFKKHLLYTSKERPCGPHIEVLSLWTIADLQLTAFEGHTTVSHADSANVQQIEGK